MHAAAYSVSSIKIFTRGEIRDVLADLHRKSKRSLSSHENLIIFRLSCCCGLRVSEIVGLQLNDLKLEHRRPHIQVRKEVGKGGKARKVPLWWDSATLQDLQAWKALRLAQIGSECDGTEPFVCNLQQGSKQQNLGSPLLIRTCQARFKTAIKCLGAERVRDLAIHAGRHSFCSHALANGISLTEVRDAAGHCSVSVTNTYLHVAKDDETFGNLFAF